MLHSALVVDVGYSECSVIPVIEGVTLLDSVQFGPHGSKAIHDRIHKGLIDYEAKIKDNVNFEERPLTDADRLDEKVLEDIKVRACFIAPFERGQRLVEIRKSGDKAIFGSPKSVDFPVDGTKLVKIPGTVREDSCQVLFEIYGHESCITTLILEALRQCPRDSRKLLAENIVLIGGTTLLPGFRHRLSAEVHAIVKADNFYNESLHFENFKFHSTPCKENYVAWLGAAIIGSTDAITMRAITRDQYLRSNGAVLTDWSEWWPPARVA